MPNSISNIFSSLRSVLWKKKTNSAVGIDIGSSSVKVVQLRKDKGRAILETYGELALGPYKKDGFVGQAVILPPENVAEALKNVFKESNITAINAAVSVPLKSCLLTLIEIPLVDKDKIDQMIPIEARKYIPVPISEVTLDWWIIPQKEVSEETFKAPVYTKRIETVEVLVVAIHNSALENHQNILNLASVKNSSFEIEIFSSVRSIFKHDMSATLVLDIGASTTKIIIVDYGIVRISHLIDKGSQDITLSLSKSLGVDFSKAEETKRKLGVIGGTAHGNVVSIINQSLEYLLFEANNVMVNYQKKYKRSINKVILIGGGSMLKGLKEAAAKRFNVEVVYGDPFSKTDAPAFLEPVLKEAGPTFAVAAGLALKEL